MVVCKKVEQAVAAMKCGATSLLFRSDSPMSLQKVQLLSVALQSNGTLEALELGSANTHGDIGDEGARMLAESLKDNTVLTMFTLSDTSAGEAGITALTTSLLRSPVLASLTFRSVVFGPNTVASLATTLQGDSALTALNLTGNCLADEGLAALAPALDHNVALTSLSIIANFVGNRGAQVLAEALKASFATRASPCLHKLLPFQDSTTFPATSPSHNVLRYLDLSHNPIGPAGVAALSDALLEHNASVTSLSLNGNQVGPVGANALAEVLRQNATLTSLDLLDAAIGSDGAKALVESLTDTSALTSLCVQGNNIGDDGASAVAAALSRNASLTAVGLCRNNISTRAVEVLAEALMLNTTLTDTDLMDLDQYDDDGFPYPEELKQVVDQILLENEAKARGRVSLPSHLEGRPRCFERSGCEPVDCRGPCAIDDLALSD